MVTWLKEGMLLSILTPGAFCCYTVTTTSKIFVTRYEPLLCFQRLTGMIIYIPHSRLHKNNTSRWKLIEIHVACEYTEPLDLWYHRIRFVLPSRIAAEDLHSKYQHVWSCRLWNLILNYFVHYLFTFKQCLMEDNYFSRPSDHVQTY
jgi:hypothetical protein